MNGEAGGSRRLLRRPRSRRRPSTSDAFERSIALSPRRVARRRRPARNRRPNLRSVAAARVAAAGITLRRSDRAVGRPDACLNDVTFVDPRRGWAVGDCGAIWHTADGEHWEQQASGVDCRLKSVQFLDADNGWAAGGFTLPYTHISCGVMLRTVDGGKHWTRRRKAAAAGHPAAAVLQPDARLGDRLALGDVSDGDFHDGQRRPRMDSRRRSRRARRP